MTEKLMEVKLYQLAVEAQQATEAAAGQFPPFEGLALSIQLKKAAKAAVAHVTEAFGRHNAGDRIRLLRLAQESSEQVVKGLGAALKSKLIKQPEYDALKEQWAAANGEIEEHVGFLEAGGEMDAPLPGT
ncbi:MAG: four helix bundle protein [Armatimonadota bacterium]|nr:four helix bundle protein [Armatimonadota bacterium]